MDSLAQQYETRRFRFGEPLASARLNGLVLRGLLKHKSDRVGLYSLDADHFVCRFADGSVGHLELDAADLTEDSFILPPDEQHRSLLTSDVAEGALELCRGGKILLPCLSIGSAMSLGASDTIANTISALKTFALTHQRHESIRELLMLIAEVEIMANEHATETCVLMGAFARATLYSLLIGTNQLYSADVLAIPQGDRFTIEWIEDYLGHCITLTRDWVWKHRQEIDNPTELSGNYAAINQAGRFRVGDIQELYSNGSNIRFISLQQPTASTGLEAEENHHAT